MSGDARSPFSAAEQGLGYTYEARFALLKILELPEDSSLLLEKDDDVDFEDASGRKSLMSLKHKAVGDTVTDLATDFWKSVRIWLAHYKANGRISCDARFILFAKQTDGELVLRNTSGAMSSRNSRAAERQLSGLCHSPQRRP